MLMKFPMAALVYHPTLLASTLTSFRCLIISFWQTMLALARGAAAASADASFWWLSSPDTSTVGKGNELVTSRTPLVSMPTIEPVAVVGNVDELCFVIFITTCSRAHG